MDEDARYAQGRRVILDIWGEREGAEILDRWRALSPDLERQIVSFMFGDLWARPVPAASRALAPLARSLPPSGTSMRVSEDERGDLCYQFRSERTVLVGGTCPGDGHSVE